MKTKTAGLQLKRHCSSTRYRARMPNIIHHSSAASARPTVACEAMENWHSHFLQALKTKSWSLGGYLAFGFWKSGRIYNPLFNHSSDLLVSYHLYSSIQPSRFQVFLLAQTTYLYRYFIKKSKNDWATKAL